MKIKLFNRNSVERRILRAAKENNISLVILCKQWEPLTKQESKGKPLDPVSCLLSLKRWEGYVLRGAISLEIAAIIIVCTSGVTQNPVAIFFTATIPAMLYLLLWPRRPNNDLLWKVQNAINFVESIEMAEKIESVPFERWFEGGSLADPLKKIEHNLRLKAKEKEDLGRIPWQSQKAEAKHEEWKKLHALMRCLFPDLPENYNYYFNAPKEDKQENTDQTSSGMVNAT